MRREGRQLLVESIVGVMKNKLSSMKKKYSSMQNKHHPLAYEHPLIPPHSKEKPLRQ